VKRAGSHAWILLPLLLLPALASAGTDSVRTSANPSTDSARPLAALADSPALAPPSPQPLPGPSLTPSLAWHVGVGAPAFPQRDRFRSELARRTTLDSLVVDQPWEGSQLGFSTGFEAAVQRGWLRPALGVEWSFWDSRSVHHSRRDDTPIERTWRVDQLLGTVGLDALIAPSILKVNAAEAPFVGFRYAQGIGRIEGLGRAWASGNGLQFHLGADVTSIGPLVVAGRLGWNSLSFRSSTPWNRVVYGEDTPGDVSWNGSGLWMRVDFRLRPAPPAADTLGSRRVRSPAKP